MTPVVKLVFGADYDKTRLTEYAAVLSHAHRMEVARGMLAGFLAQAEGGLKGVVKAERQLRREESGKDHAENPRKNWPRTARTAGFRPRRPRPERRRIRPGHDPPQRRWRQSSWSAKCRTTLACLLERAARKLVG